MQAVQLNKPLLRVKINATSRTRTAKHRRTTRCYHERPRADFAAHTASADHRAGDLTF